MARSRNIKPGFFVNADLVELPPLVRLLFIGLWTIADREGRLEDRPAQIKMQILPGDDIDTGQALCKLDASRFIHRYSVDGKNYIEILKFKKHQNPHIKEPKSIIPPPQPIENAEGNTNTIPVSCKHRACLVLAGLIPDSLLLIPDSLLLIPDKPALVELTDSTKDATGGGQAEQSFTERQIRESIETNRSLLVEKYPGVDIDLEAAEMIAKYKNISIGADPGLIVLRWFKNLRKHLDGEGKAEQVRAANHQVAREFVDG